ncbi:thioredoxin domain-containing protein [Butyricimonas paravirosa]|uniref:thioredoxin domain-containing protein n=1 Tax=Butyricimonas paravirosa TaxID=1472417 RepID=UPI0022E76A90|nr:thioredoxin domain-containing protein [Butyricimonas paravirosa]
MRRSVVLIVLFWAMGLNALAQTQGIMFEPTRSWKKIVEKARSENKLIFVDCYADWCGPCKQLASQVFTQKEVGDVFNSHFVNVQFNVEKDADGKVNVAKWGVASLPTLVFIDPKTEQVIGKLVGAGDAAWLVNGAKAVLDPAKRLDVLATRYNAGEREPAFLLEFIKALGSAGMNAEVQQVVKEWLDGLSLDQLATPRMWPIIMQFENDPLSKTLLTVRDHIDRFYAIPLENQRAMVDATLMGAMVQTAMEFSTNPNLGIYEQDRFNAFVDYLDQAKEGPGKTMAAVWLNTSQLARQGDWKQMLEAMREVERENVFPPQLYGPYFSFFIQALTQVKEQKAAVEAGLKWLDELIMKAAGEDVVSYQTRAMMNAGKVALWQALGKSAEMKKAQKEMEKYVNLLKANPGNHVNEQMSGVVPGGVSQGLGDSQASREITLNYEFRQGVPVVKVEINGHTYYFLFDTCAGITCVSDKLVNTEKLAYQQTGNAMQGMSDQVVMAEIPVLSLGGLVLKGRQAAVMSEHNPVFKHLGVDGTIGANVINEFVVTIDARNKTITLSDRVDPSISRWETLKLWNNVPLLSIKVQGKGEDHDVPALFDTGNGTGAIGLPSVEGFEQWTQAGIIGDVEEGNGFIGTMVGGMVKTDKLYRGRMTGLHLGNAVFKKMPIITGGIGYLLLCFKTTDLGVFTLDYPNGRYHFEPYVDASVWEGDSRPVMTGSDNGVLKIAAVWGKEASKRLAPRWTVIALDGKPLESMALDSPNIDEMIRERGVKTVTVRDTEGKEYEVKAEVFLPSMR